MPAGPSADATATIPVSSDPSGSGSVSITSANGGASGALSIDTSVIDAFTAKDRKVGAKLELDGEAMATLSDEVTVTESLADPVKTSTFQLVDARTAISDAATVVNGDKDVRLTIYAGPPKMIRSITAFTGHTDRSQNEGPYLPRGHFNAISYVADWVNLPGCVRSFGFEGVKRGKIVVDYAASTTPPIPIDPAIAQLGRIITRPYEYNGEPILDLIRRLGEIEGWWPRFDDNDVLTIIPDSYVFAGDPVFYFTDSNVFSCVEAPPSRPPTRFAMSGSRMTKPSLEPGQVVDGPHTIPGVDGNGNPTAQITTVIRDGGVEISRTVEDWATFQKDGTSLGPMTFQIQKKSVEENTYERAAALPGAAEGKLTTKLTKRVTRLYDVTGVQMSVGAGGSHNWTTGVTMDRASADLLLVQEVTVLLTWSDPLVDANACTLKSQTETVKGYYAPLKSGGSTYADGSVRDGTSYTWRTLSEELTTWTDGQQTYSAPYVQKAKRQAAWMKTTADTETYVTNARFTVELWTGNDSNDHYRHVTDIVQNGVGGYHVRETDEADGPVPAPPVGASSVPQFQQEPFFLNITTDAPYVDNLMAEVIEAAEDETELQNVAMRRLVLALCTKVTITHPNLPYLRPGDPVLFSNRARQYSGRRAFVDSIATSVRVTGRGGGRQTTTLMILPLWPPWPPAVGGA